MTIIANYKQARRRNKANNSRIGLLAQSILTFFFIKIPKFNSFWATGPYNSTIKWADIINFLSMSSKLHNILNFKLILLKLDIIDLNFFRLTQSIDIISYWIYFSENIIIFFLSFYIKIFINNFNSFIITCC